MEFLIATAFVLSIFALWVGSAMMVIYWWED
jgi:hypothetical protein